MAAIDFTDFTEARPAPAASAAVTVPAADDGFTVNVRNTEALLQLNRKKSSDRAGRILSAAAFSAFIIALFCLILGMAGAYGQMPYTIAGALVFILVDTTSDKLNETVSRLIKLIIAVLLIAVLIIMRKYIGNGTALLINQLYDFAEEAQSYAYTRHNVGGLGDEAPYLCMGIAAGWWSAAAGFIVALAGHSFKGITCTITVVAALLAFAYFGMEPGWIIMMALIAAFMVCAGSGRITTSWPLLLAALLIFGLIVFIDPGPNYTVSRANENIRDRIAFRTAYIDGMQGGSVDDMDNDGVPDGKGMDSEWEDNGGHGWILLWIGLGLIVAAGVLIYLFLRRVRLRRAAIRAGLDSKDPNTAIGAMFPYAVRWLKVFDMDTGKAFADLIPGVRENMSPEYAAGYTEMYDLWQEAVYSDHELTGEDMQNMSGFMKQTIDLAKKNAGLMDKLRIRYKYAL